MRKKKVVPIVLCNMSEDNLRLFLRRTGACSEAKRVFRGMTLSQAWEQCEKEAWLRFFLREVAYHQTSVEVRNNILDHVGFDFAGLESQTKFLKERFQISLNTFCEVS